jgi:hypothetical protein
LPALGALTMITGALFGRYYPDEGIRKSSNGN